VALIAVEVVEGQPISCPGKGHASATRGAALGLAGAAFGSSSRILLPHSSQSQRQNTVNGGNLRASGRLWI
jgi:hypothetical protein